MDYTEIEKKRFGRRLRAYRIQAGATLRELAQRISINFQELYRYEKGIREPRDSILNSLAEALVVDPNKLRYGDPQSDRSPFFCEEFGNGYGKEYRLMHLYGKTEEVDIDCLTSKIKKLSQEDLKVVNELVENLYLDSHPEKLKEVIENEALRLEAVNNGITKVTITDSYSKAKRTYRDDLYRLFPEKYDEVIEGKKRFAEVDDEVYDFINEKYPDLLDVLRHNEKTRDVFKQLEEHKKEGTSFIPSSIDLLALLRVVHSNLVPELWSRMQKDYKNRPGKGDYSEVYEVNLNDHIMRMYREGRTNKELTENINKALVEHSLVHGETDSFSLNNKTVEQNHRIVHELLESYK